MDRGQWRELARRQDGMLSLRQLDRLGVPRGVVRHKLASERWTRRTDRVVAISTGELTAQQRRWLGVLHVGGDALVGGLSAAAHAGLRGWSREEVTVLVDAGCSPEPVTGVQYVRTRRSLRELRGTRPGALPVCAVEPAVLLFAAREPSERTAQGALAAVVQQRLTTPDRLSTWRERLRPLPRSRLFERLLLDLAGGAQTLAEVDVRRMCRRYGLPLPQSQKPRRDRDGRLRYTDCEWSLPNGHVLVLEVDGWFHTETEQWTADLRRHRRLTTAGRTIVRCSALEVRDDPQSLAEDLAVLGVGRSCA